MPSNKTRKQRGRGAKIAKISADLGLSPQHTFMNILLDDTKTDDDVRAAMSGIDLNELITNLGYLETIYNESNDTGYLHALITNIIVNNPVINTNANINQRVREIEAGATVNIQRTMNRTPRSTINKSKVDKLILLLDSGANINLQTSTGLSPLHIAVIKFNSYIIKLLVKRGANLEIRDSFGFTPLFTASYYGYPTSTIILGNLGARGNIVDNQGRELIDIICEGDSEFDINNNDYMQYTYLPIKEAVCKAGANKSKCGYIEPDLVNIGPMSSISKRRSIRNAYTDPSGIYHKAELEPIESEFTFERILPGNTMINFNDELQHGRFYKQNAWNNYKKLKQTHNAALVSPHNPDKVISKVTRYTVGWGGRRSRRKGSRRSK